MADEIERVLNPIVDRVLAHKPVDADQKEKRRKGAGKSQKNKPVSKTKGRRSRQKV